MRKSAVDGLKVKFVDGVFGIFDVRSHKDIDLVYRVFFVIIVSSGMEGEKIFAVLHERNLFTTSFKREIPFLKEGAEREKSLRKIRNVVDGCKPYYSLSCCDDH